MGPAPGRGAAVAAAQAPASSVCDGSQSWVCLSLPPSPQSQPPTCRMLRSCSSVTSRPATSSRLWSLPPAPPPSSPPLPLPRPAGPPHCPSSWPSMSLSTWAPLRSQAQGRGRWVEPARRLNTKLGWAALSATPLTRPLLLSEAAPPCRAPLSLLQALYPPCAPRAPDAAQRRVVDVGGHLRQLGLDAGGVGGAGLDVAKRYTAGEEGGRISACMHACKPHSACMLQMNWRRPGAAKPAGRRAAHKEPTPHHPR